MTQEKPDMLFCQSCGMPMENKEDFGTNRAGARNSSYCHFCFVDGEFTDPDITMEEMIEKVVKFMVKYIGIPEKEANQTANTLIPRLKRWE